MAIYVFMDESGSLGAPQDKKDKYFLIGIVVVENIDKVQEIQEKVDDFRNSINLPKDFEYHFNRNSDKQKRLFLEYVSKLDFNYKIFKFLKDAHLNYGEISHAISQFLNSYSEDICIIMDSNPHLHRELSRTMKGNSKRKIKIKEQRSQSNALIQIADYVVGAANKELTSSKIDRYEKYLKLKKLP